MLHVELSQTCMVAGRGLRHFSQVFLVVLDGILVVLRSFVSVRQGLDDTGALVLVVELLVKGLVVHGDSLVVALQSIQGVAVVHIVHVGDVGRVRLVEQTVGKVECLVIVALLCVAEHSQTVQGRVAWLFLKT